MKKTARKIGGKAKGKEKKEKKAERTCPVCDTIVEEDRGTCPECDSPLE